MKISDSFYLKVEEVLFDDDRIKREQPIDIVPVEKVEMVDSPKQTHMFRVCEYLVAQRD